MLAFSVGELSTQMGVGNQRVFGTNYAQQFNPADFPCPPPSIMVGESPDEEIM